ncbi:MAG: SDR family NAD(P)-dependent oxidoreductase [Agriterribacter sp.]
MPYALVTGAAKGIGKAIAQQLAVKGYDLLLIDIDSEKLQQAQQQLQSSYQQRVEIFSVDLSHVEAAEQIKTWSTPWHNQLKILVNNAAFGLNGAFNELSLKEQLDIVNVNVKAVVSLCHLFIPVLKNADKAYILNIGSNAGYQPVPYLNMYASSKAFIISFTRSLRYELRNSNISVSCVSPGSTDTNFVDRAGMGTSIRKTADRYNMTPDAVAKIAVQSLFNKRAERITGFSTKLGIFLSWLAPKSLSEKFGANIFEKND